MDQLVHLTPHVGADGFFVFAMLPEQDGAAATESRMFCPVIGVPEDPVSGNAHGMLGVYLVHNGLLTPGADRACRFVGHQGRFVDRPGRVDVEVTASGRRATGCPRDRRRGDRLRGGVARLVAKPGSRDHHDANKC